MMADHANDHNHEAFLDMCKRGEVAGVDGNAAGNHGLTALMMAACRGHLAVVKLLIQRPGFHIRSLEKKFHYSQMSIPSGK